MGGSRYVEGWWGFPYLKIKIQDFKVPRLQSFEVQKIKVVSSKGQPVCNTQFQCISFPIIKFPKISFPKWCWNLFLDYLECPGVSEDK